MQNIGIVWWWNSSLNKKVVDWVKALSLTSPKLGPLCLWQCLSFSSPKSSLRRWNGLWTVLKLKGASCGQEQRGSGQLTSCRNSSDDIAIIIFKALSIAGRSFFCAFVFSVFCFFSFFCAGYASTCINKCNVQILQHAANERFSTSPLVIATYFCFSLHSVVLFDFRSEWMREKWCFLPVLSSSSPSPFFDQSLPPSFPPLPRGPGQS